MNFFKSNENGDRTVSEKGLDSPAAISVNKRNQHLSSRQQTVRAGYKRRESYNDCSLVLVLYKQAVGFSLKISLRPDIFPFSFTKTTGKTAKSRLFAEKKPKILGNLIY